jgi:hypothetical protein
MKNYVVYFLVAIICAITACNVDEEPCPQFPSRYEQNLSFDNFRIDLIHEIVGGELIPLDWDIDSLNAALLVEEEFEEVLGDIFFAITLVDESIVEFAFRDVDGTEQVESLPYAPRSEQFYTVDLGSGESIVVEVADNCSYIDYCTGADFISITGDFDESFASTFRNIFCEGRPLEQFLPTDIDYSRFEDGGIVGIIHFSIRFFLDN